MSDAAPSDMRIIYTYTDEAPALATHSLLPVLQAYADKAGVAVETRDISLAARVLAAFDLAPDALAELGELARTPQANIIKLPNVSASVPQLKAAIAELQADGHAVPDYPETPATDEERAARAAYDAVKGSAVNPVLREGNSDRRAPASVKRYAQRHPHSMGAWSPDTRSHVATMSDGDFRHSETSVTVPAATTLRIEHVAADGSTTVLKDGVRVLQGEIVDAAVMHAASLREFLAQQVADAKEQGVLFSVHLKATMMKVSDPIIFGHVVKAYFADVFEQYADDLASVGADPNQGLAACWPTCSGCPRTAGRRSRPPSRRRTSRDRRWRRWTRARASPTCTCRATSSSTRRCRRRSARRGRCGTRRTSCRTPSSSSRTRPTPRSTRRRSSTAASTAPSTRPPWAPPRTSA
jgi:isocitrate dehydrogenase